MAAEPGAEASIVVLRDHYQEVGIDAVDSNQVVLFMIWFGLALTAARTSLYLFFSF